MRNLPNVVILCTSNLIHAIDAAFLDRVDIKTCIPTPSPAAIYNIFRSCLNELVRASLIDLAASSVSSGSAIGVSSSSSPDSHKRRAITVASPKRIEPSNDQIVKTSSPSSPLSDPPPSSPHSWTDLTVPTIPTREATIMTLSKQPDSPGWRVLELAKKCEGFSGRTLRRLPILGLAMYTWGGNCSLEDAISALKAAIDEELKVKQSASEPV